MILVTSGADEHISNCLPSAVSSGVTIHSIALGSSAAGRLEELSHLTGKSLSRRYLLEHALKAEHSKLSYDAQVTCLHWGKEMGKISSKTHKSLLKLAKNFSNFKMFFLQLKFCTSNANSMFVILLSQLENACL